MRAILMFPSWVSRLRGYQSGLTFTGFPVGPDVYRAPSQVLHLRGLPVGPYLHRAPNRALRLQGSQSGLMFTGLPVGPYLHRAPNRAFRLQGSRLMFTGLAFTVLRPYLYSAQALPLQCSQSAVKPILHTHCPSTHSVLSCPLQSTPLQRSAHD